MTTHLSPSRRLSRYSLDRSMMNRTTFIEDVPQEELHQNQQQYRSLHTIVDDESPVARKYSRRSTAKSAQFDDLYDMSEDEMDEIPVQFTASLSNGQQTPSLHKRFPSLVIPSPAAWPTIQNYQKKGEDAPILSPHLVSPAIVSPTPRMLSQLAARPIDSTSSAPSLDGSLTSEELSSLSCPSTPDLERRNHDMEWSSPLQLRPEAMQTLTCITGNLANGESPILFRAEMREVGEMQSQQAPQLDVDVTITPVTYSDQSELSALSVPSPGGFFSALEPSSRHTWSLAQEEIPTTTIAERFYGVPWAQDTTEQVIEYGDDDNTEGPPTARRIPLASPRSVVTAQRSPSPQFQNPENFPSEYKENYAEELQVVGQSNFDRTSMWLQQQCGGYESDDSSSVRSGFSSKKQNISPIEELEEPEEEVSQPSEVVPVVRFVLEEASPKEPEQTVPIVKDSTLLEAVREYSETKGAEDAFVHRKVRTDKFRLDRKCLFKNHLKTLENKFELDNEEEMKCRRPVSDMFGPEETEESQAIAKALRQRRALEQIKPISWNLEATKMLNGGSLLTSPTGKLMPKIDHGRVLDLGGQTSCDWAWQVAFEHPSSTVHTVFTADQTIDPAIQGPLNHKQTRVPNLWTLPFPSDHFHIISARNLMALLKTDKPAGKARDEYDLCLRECMRVLKPGGYLEFALLDADIVGGGQQSNATSADFCHNLKRHGYDPAPTKVWLPRLRRAGFAQVRRAWLNLPLAQAAEIQGTTADASHITGLVGSWAWERWMLKLHTEMGRDADGLLEDVPLALEEGSRTGASWRYLSGWARKPM